MRHLLSSRFSRISRPPPETETTVTILLAKCRKLCSSIVRLRTSENGKVKRQNDKANLRDNRGKIEDKTIEKIEGHNGKHYMEG
jgi:hypothetical protein